MDKIVLEKADGLREAVDFAGRQFGLDFRQFQPKLYGHEDAGMTWTLRRDGQIAGMVSGYPVQYGSMRCLSVGTVCTDAPYRGQGVMGALFAHLQRHVFPEYDVIMLAGRRERYERFGFAKALWFAEYGFYPQSGGGLRLLPAGERDGERLLRLWQTYGSGTQRRGDRMEDILKSAGHEAYLLHDGAQWGYLSAHRGKRRVTEYCGPWPAQPVIDSLAALWGPGRISLLGRYNGHDRDLLACCDSYTTHNHGSIRVQSGDMGLRETYQLCGYGGAEPGLKLPSSLIYLDGI